jgi:hypothetical protein
MVSVHSVLMSAADKEVTEADLGITQRIRQDEKFRKLAGDCPNGNEICYPILA